MNKEDRIISKLDFAKNTLRQLHPVQLQKALEYTLQTLVTNRGTA